MTQAPHEEAAALSAPPPAARRRSRARLLLVLFPLLMAVVVGVAVCILLTLSVVLGDGVGQVPDAFQGIDSAQRPAPQPALTVLLVGVDSRSPDPTTGTGATGPAFVPGAQRSDSLLLAQFTPDRTAATVVSVPRDLWVDVPGHGRTKINAAYSLGGPSLLVRTVENLTRVHIDHLAVVDFAGFRAVVDALGGVDVPVAAATSSGGVQFAAGVDHLDGEQALTYVRQRHDLPAGDLSRVRRQQNLLRAVLDRLAANDTLAQPRQLFAVLDAAAHSISVDPSLSGSGLFVLAFELRGLRAAGTTFLTAPVAGSGREGAQDVLYLDTASAQQLWDALRGGDPRDYARRHPADVLGDTPS